MRRIGARGSGGALALAMLAGTAQAQQASDFRLPQASTSPSQPAAQGPVDPDNPVVRAPAERPSATPAPQASPTPETQVQAPVAQATRAARQTRTPAPRPTVAPVPLATTTPEPTATPTATPTTTAQPLQVAPLTAPPTTSLPGWYWPWLAGGAALLAAIFALLWWRRRPRRETETAFEPPVVRPAPAPATPEPAPTPAAAPFAEGLVIELEARRLNASLVAATLSYTIRLANRSGEPLAALAIEAELASAHASLPVERQIASPGQRLELRHALVSLAAGEVVEFSGDLRLPLAAITPIMAGNAAYFVPLARARIEAATPGGSARVEARTWVIGERGKAEGGGLRPFRLDTGPRTYSRIGERAVS